MGMTENWLERAHRDEWKFYIKLRDGDVWGFLSLYDSDVDEHGFIYLVRAQRMTTTKSGDYDQLVRKHERPVAVRLSAVDSFWEEDS